MRADVDNIARFKTDNSLRRFDEKQEIEKRVVLKKMQSGRMDIEKKREGDLQTIVNKYKALKENQDKAQKSEVIELERGFMSFKPYSNIYASQVAYGESENGQSEDQYDEDQNHNQEVETPVQEEEHREDDEEENQEEYRNQKVNNQ